MADPISAMAALGLAANIGQLVEYAISIVSKTRDIRKSLDGILPENRHTAVVTESFYAASCTLSGYLENCKIADQALSPEDERLKEISRSCAAIASSLLEELDRLRLKSDKHVKWNSFRQALKAAWGKGKLDILANTLEMYRNELKTILQISILKRLDVTQTRLAGLDQTSQKILEETQISRKLSENNFNVLLQHVRSPLSPSTVEQPEQKGLIECSSIGDVESLRSLVLQGVDIEATDDMEFTALMTASRAGHSDAVRFLLSQGAQLEAHDTNGNTSLILAAAEGHEAVVRLLLDASASVEARESSTSQTALIKALLNRHWQVADLLHQRGTSQKSVAQGLSQLLVHVAEHGQYDIMSWLTKVGINVDTAHDHHGRTALALASNNGHAPVVNLLLKVGACTEIRDRGGFTPIHSATCNGYLGIVKALLRAGANANTINKGGYSALADASLHGYPHIVDALVLSGAYLETRDDAQYTPLCRAAQHEQFATVKRLLKHGANTAAQNRDGWTALAEASCRREDTVRLLLESGANTEISGDVPGETGEKGWTPLMRAASFAQLGVVKALIQAGASINARTSEGRTVLTIIGNRKDQVYEFLKQAGAE